MLATSSGSNGWAFRSSSMQKMADCVGTALLYLLSASRSEQSNRSASQSTRIARPSACASPSAPSITYAGPLTPRDANNVPLTHPRASCDGTSPFHSEIGVVRTTSTGIPLLVVRTTPISEWKGLVPSQLALGCVNGTLLASRGVSGPRYIIEGDQGLAHAISQAIHVDWESERLDCLDRLALKSYNSAFPTQSAIFCM